MSKLSTDLSKVSLNGATHTLARTAEDLSKLTPYGILYVARSVNSGGTLQRDGGNVEESRSKSSDS